MHTDTMRRIDKWAGVPACFVLTLFDRLFGLLRSWQVPTGQVRKVLIVKPSEMGAIILAEPLIERITSDHPGVQVYFITFKVNSPVFDVLARVPVENVITIRDSSFWAFVADTLKALWKVRKIRPEVVIDLEFFSRFSAIITYLSGAKKRIGFYPYAFEGLYRGDLLTHKVPYNPHKHVSQAFLSMAQVISCTTKATPEMSADGPIEAGVLSRFVPSAVQQQKMRERLASVGALSKVFVFNPGEGKIPLREWPLANFVLLAQWILKDPDSFIVVVGASGIEEKSGHFLRALNSPRCVNWVNKTTISELLTLFTMAEALVANDSGLAHLASLTPIKKFVFFGPETPRVFSPLSNNTFVFYADLPCSPCLSAYNHRTSLCRDNICLKNIDPHRVYVQLREQCSLLYAVPSSSYTSS